MIDKALSPAQALVAIRWAKIRSKEARAEATRAMREAAYAKFAALPKAKQSAKMRAMRAKKIESPPLGKPTKRPLKNKSAGRKPLHAK